MQNQATRPFFALDHPIESMPGERQMRIATLGAFPNLARGFGFDPKTLLEKHNIDPVEILAPDHFIDCRDFTELLEDCSTAFNAPLLGLKLAQLHEPDVYGCIPALCRAAPTVHEAIKSFAKYIPVTHSSASAQELVIGEDVAEYRWQVRTDVGCNQQANYHAALLLMKLLRQIGGPNFRPSYVTLAVEARAKDIAALEEHFGCRFYCSTTNNSIAFPREFLHQSVASSSRTLYALLSGYLDRIKSTTESAIAEKVANYVRSYLPSGKCSIDHCAQSLGMAIRTLQTQLSDAGFEFSSILEEQRVNLAKTYLTQKQSADKQMSLDDIAVNLGYAELSSFGRAFKRWTGTTPNQYRSQSLSQDANQ